MKTVWDLEPLLFGKLTVKHLVDRSLELALDHGPAVGVSVQQLGGVLDVVYADGHGISWSLPDDFGDGRLVRVLIRLRVGFPQAKFKVKVSFTVRKRFYDRPDDAMLIEDGLNKLVAGTGKTPEQCRLALVQTGGIRHNAVRLLNGLTPHNVVSGQFLGLYPDEQLLGSYRGRPKPNRQSSR